MQFIACSQAMLQPKLDTGEDAGNGTLKAFVVCILPYLFDVCLGSSVKLFKIIAVLLLSFPLLTGEAGHGAQQLQLRYLSSSS